MSIRFILNNCIYLRNNMNIVIVIQTIFCWLHTLSLPRMYTIINPTNYFMWCCLSLIFQFLFINQTTWLHVQIKNSVIINIINVLLYSIYCWKILYFRYKISKLQKNWMFRRYYQLISNWTYPCTSSLSPSPPRFSSEETAFSVKILKQNEKKNK